MTLPSPVQAMPLPSPVQAQLLRPPPPPRHPMMEAAAAVLPLNAPVISPRQTGFLVLFPVPSLLSSIFSPSPRFRSAAQHLKPAATACSTTSTIICALSSPPPPSDLSLHPPLNLRRSCRGHCMSWLAAKARDAPVIPAAPAAALLPSQKQLLFSSSPRNPKTPPASKRSSSELQLPLAP